MRDTAARAHVLREALAALRPWVVRVEMPYAVMIELAHVSRKGQKKLYIFGELLDKWQETEGLVYNGGQ